LLCLSATALADTAGDAAPAGSRGYSQFAPPYTGLSNADLASRADQLKDSDLSALQPDLDYRWLSDYSGSDQAFHGTKAVNRLVEQQLKHYLYNHAGGAWIKDKLMPDGSGFIKSVDYDLKLRHDELVIGVSYEF
jgi:hypothetical protein